MDGVRTITEAEARRMTPEQARAALRAAGYIAPCDMKPMTIFVRLALEEYARARHR